MSKKLALVALDVISLYVALILTLAVRYGAQYKEQLNIHILPFTIVFMLWILVFYITNLYEISAVKNSILFYSDLARAIILASGLAITAFYLLPILLITPKTNLFIFIVIISILLLAFRSALNSLAGNSGKNKTLIVGFNELSLELARELEANPQLGYEVKYIIDINPTTQRTEESFEKFGIIQGVENINKIIREEKINTVIVSQEAYKSNEIIDIFYKSIENKVNFTNLSSFFEKITSRIPLGAISQAWFLDNLSEGSKKGFEFLKRLLDIVFAIFIGIFVLAISPLIMLVIKIDSSGPIFYKQKRLGQSGKIFEIIKFRTMTQDAEKDGAVWAQENDPRITSIGKFLRKSRIDELPQIWNIIKGEMSFVGPRAERPEFHDKLKQGISYYEERYLVKPGLTGWAQINFRYGASVQDSAYKLQYDLYYIKNRSLFLDLGIILKTINITLRHAGR